LSSHHGKVVPASSPPVIVVEDDPFTRLVGVVLDPTTSAERRAAFADFFAHDLPNFDDWCDRVRSQAAGLFPADVRVVVHVEALREQAADARALVVESIPVSRAELDAAPRLAAIHKYGVNLRSIDTAACTARGIKVLTIRRRANIACAEHAMALTLMLSRKVNRLLGRITVERLAQVGYAYKPYDRRHTANSNWARIGGLRIVHGTTVGIIGLGEIGREFALRANAFGMNVLYHQRNRWPEADERAMNVSYRPFEALLAESDWVLPLVPSEGATGLIDRARFAQMKPGASLINISRADVVDRGALLDALRSGRLAGFALDPQYEAPSRSDDELLTFDNVILTPHIAAQPRFNALDDITDMIAALARELRGC
jgi:phosphoglycerate dehydrogenase-like enzyme